MLIMRRPETNVLNTLELYAYPVESLRKYSKQFCDRTMQPTLRAPQTTRTARNNDQALDASIAAKAEIDAMLAQLQALSADHFQTDSVEIHWGHDGTLNHCRARLREITDMAFAEGVWNDKREVDDAGCPAV
jgi:transglutaminase/protease-like cytokinesis protein 3